MLQAAAELTGPQAARLLPLVRDFYGEGCNNEALRIFSPIGVSSVEICLSVYLSICPSIHLSTTSICARRTRSKSTPSPRMTPPRRGCSA